MISTSVDDTHDILERNILEQTIRLDDFFGNNRTESRPRTGYEIRWRNALRMEEGGHSSFGTTVRANVVLSKISERLQLAITGENATESFSPNLPADPGNPGFDRTATQTPRLVNSELRYSLHRTPAAELFVGAGVRFVLPFEAFLRTRYLHTKSLGRIGVLHFGETVFLKNGNLLGETTEISLERLPGKGTLLRWASIGTASQEIEGLEWGSELSLLRQLSAKSAVTVAGGLFGNSDNSYLISNYRVLARYRKNFLRDWLFYELEPEVSWPRNQSGSYRCRVALTFRLEVVFQGRATGAVLNRAERSITHQPG